MKRVLNWLLSSGRWLVVHSVPKKLRTTPFSTWLLSRKRWLVVLIASIPLLTFVAWLLTFRTAALFIFIISWLVHVGLGAGAGYAALRLWYFRHHPLIKWMGVYILAFIIDALSAIVLLFVAKGVKFTWKFSTVMFVSALVSNLFRAPLIFYLIRGPQFLPGAEPSVEPERSGEMPPEFWESFRKIVREEVRRALRPRSKASTVSRKRR